MSKYFPYCQGPSYFQISVRHFEAPGEFPHQEDRDGKHEEGEENVDPEVESVPRVWGTQIGQGGVAELCGVS